MGKKSGFRWGFEWVKVGSGALMLLAGGGIALVGWLAGGIVVWAFGLAVVGLITMLSGLMGEEGIW
jgi:hypothetical protein